MLLVDLALSQGFQQYNTLACSSIVFRNRFINPFYECVVKNYTLLLNINLVRYWCCSGVSKKYDTYMQVCR